MNSSSSAKDSLPSPVSIVAGFGGRNETSFAETSGPLTIHTTRTVRPACEASFEVALREFVQNTLEVPGQISVFVLRPAPGAARQFSIVRRFADASARDAFYHSALFVAWLQAVEPLSWGEPHHEELSGLETWFTLPEQGAIVPPPRSKMALVTLAAVFPASVLVPLALQPLNGAWPLVARVFLNSAAIVALLTWLVMPLFTRLLRTWLYGSRS